MRLALVALLASCGGGGTCGADPAPTTPESGAKWGCLRVTTPQGTSCGCTPRTSADLPADRTERCEGAFSCCYYYSYPVTVGSMTTVSEACNCDTKSDDCGSCEFKARAFSGRVVGSCGGPAPASG